MTSRFKFSLALLAALALGCLLVFVFREGGDLPAGSGTELRGDGEAQASDRHLLQDDPSLGTIQDRPHRAPADGSDSLVGSRTPEGLDLSDPEARAAEVHRLLVAYPVDWQRISKIVGLMSEPIPEELRPALLHELKSGRRNQVLFVFATLRDPSLVDDLFLLLDDPAVIKGARGAVLTALWQMPGADGDDVARRLEGRLAGDVAKDVSVLEAIAKRGGGEAARAMVEYLQRNADPRRVPPHVLRSLDVTDPKAAEVVAEALARERTPKVQRALIEMATRPGAKAMVEPLLDLDREGVDDAVRIQALSALGRIADPRGVEYLIEQAAQPGTMGEHAARAIALVNTTDPAVAASLAKALDVADRGPRPTETKKSLLLAIGAARNPSALRTVAATLDDRDQGVRHAAVEAMERMGHRSRAYVGKLARLFEQGDAATRLRVAVALGSIGGAESVTHLRAWVKEKGLSTSLRSTLQHGLSHAERELARENG